MINFKAAPAVLPAQLPAGAVEDLSTGNIYSSANVLIAIDNNDGTALGVDASGTFNGYSFIIPNGGIINLAQMPASTQVVAVTTNIKAGVSPTAGSSSMIVILVLAAITAYFFMFRKKS